MKNADGWQKSAHRFSSPLFAILVILSVDMLLTDYHVPLDSNTYPGMIKSAFGDGLAVEYIPPTAIDGRQLSLFVKMQPTIATGKTDTIGSNNSISLQTRLFEPKDNQTVSNVTYYLLVKKVEGEGSDGRLLISDNFHSPSGPLTVNILPTKGFLEVNSTQEPYLNAWVADKNGSINYKTPELFDSGLYHLQVMIFSIDKPDNVFREEDAPTFNSWLSIPDTTMRTLEYDGKAYNITITSYYDKIQEFDFDANAKTFLWRMPFD
jgi:hypothetical protein